MSHWSWLSYLVGFFTPFILMALFALFSKEHETEDEAGHLGPIRDGADFKGKVIN